MTLSSTVINALNRLVNDLYGYDNPSYPTSDIFTKFRAIYPFVGGSAVSHAKNLVDPTLYQITWGGSPTHSVAGIQFAGGVGQWGNTHLRIGTDLGESDRSFITYTDNHISVGCLFGIYSGTLGKGDYIRVSGTSVVQYSIPHDPYPDPGNAGLNFAKAKSIQLAGTTQKLYGSGIMKHTSVTPQSSVLGNIYLGAVNDVNNVNGWVNTDEGTFAWLGAGHRMAFFAAGNSLSDIEHKNFASAINAFQSSLSRA